LVHASTLEAARTPHLGDLVGVLPGFGRQSPNPWGLGFEIRGTKSPHWTGADNSEATFGHFGRSGCFLWVDPVLDGCCAVVTDRDFGPWAAEVWPPFNDAVVAEIRGVGAPPPPQHRQPAG
jgi:CubicO group peptidase (beta-lactamase class C family)